MLRDAVTTCLVTGLLAPLTWELAESWPQRASAILYIGGAWTLWTVWKICERSNEWRHYDGESH